MLKIRVLTVFWRCSLKAKVLVSVGWDSVTVQQCRGLCAQPSRLLMDTLRQMIDIPSRTPPQGFGGALTIVDKRQYPDALLQVFEAGKCDPSR